MINKDLIKYDRNNPNSNNSLYALYVQVRLDFNQLYSIIYILGGGGGVMRESGQRGAIAGWYCGGG